MSFKLYMINYMQDIDFYLVFNFDIFYHCFLAENRKQLVYKKQN